MAIQLRPAVPGDELEVASVHVRSWQVGYRDLLPQASLAAMRPEDRAARYTFGDPDPTVPKTIVAIDDEGAIVGFIATRSIAGEPGKVLALYVEPAHWGRGIGQILIAAARERLAALGHREATLWLLEGNARGARFYAADGWLLDGEHRVEELWGVQVSELRYRRAL